MGRIVTTYPELPAFIQTLVLGDVQYRLRLTWRDRTAAWYADLYTLDGTAVWLGQRVSTRWALGFGLEPENSPEGLFIVRGPDVYERANLGDTLEIVFYPEAEYPVFVPTAEAVTVTIP
jgi:hypothetical protein